MSPVKYVGLQLPAPLMQEVDKIVKNERNGYRSRPEFIKDATRQLLHKFYSCGGCQQDNQLKTIGGDDEDRQS